MNNTFKHKIAYYKDDLISDRTSSYFPSCFVNIFGYAFCKQKLAEAYESNYGSATSSAVIACLKRLLSISDYCPDKLYIDHCVKVNGVAFTITSYSLLHDYLLKKLGRESYLALVSQICENYNKGRHQANRSAYVRDRLIMILYVTGFFDTNTGLD